MVTTASSPSASGSQPTNAFDVAEGGIPPSSCSDAVQVGPAGQALHHSSIPKSRSTSPRETEWRGRRLDEEAPQGINSRVHQGRGDKILVSTAGRVNDGPDHHYDRTHGGTAAATKHELCDLVQGINKQIESQEKVLAKVSGDVQAFSQRLDTRETVILPNILDRLPPDPPPSPASSHGSTRTRSGPYNLPPVKPDDVTDDTIVDNQLRPVARGSESAQHNLPQQEAEGQGQGVQELSKGTLHTFEQASLRAQCSKVVAAEQASTKPPAMQPFRKAK